MTTIAQILAHTPWWVFLLFAFLVQRGMRGFAPAETSLVQLAMLPAVFMIWGLSGLSERYGLDPGAFSLWLAALTIGAAAGAALLRGTPHVDRARGVIYRPADFTILPLILVAFFSKYAMAVMAATSPAIAGTAGFRIVGLAVSGFFAGVFVGKFTRYLRAYLAAAPNPVG